MSNRPWWATPAIIIGSLFTATFIGCAFIGAALEIKRQRLERKLAEVEAMDCIEIPEEWED